MRRGGLPVLYDLELSIDDDAEVVGGVILDALQLKGCCSIKTHGLANTLRGARGEVEGLRLAGRFQETPLLIVDGLLGEEGSVETCVVASEEEPAESFAKLNELLSTIAGIIGASRFAQDMGFELTQRTAGLIHIPGAPSPEPAEPTKDAVARWLPTFVWQRLMLLLFIGPRQGTLELEPFEEGSDVLRMTTEPGMLVVLRADQMWHRFSAPGNNNSVLSCFMLQHGKNGINVLQQPPRTPIAQQLDDWAMEQMEAIFDKPEENQELDARWKYAMEHIFHKEQQTAIRGTGTKLGSTYDPEGFWKSLNSGVDIITEVPYARWNHDNYYSPDPEGWKYFKVITKHVSLCEGMELFDNKFFRISPAETKGMDPMQRHILEVGYSSLMMAGMTSKKLLQSLTAVYVGCHLSEWPMVDQGPEESGGCEQRAAGTGQAGSIMANRFSFVFGMNGPSVQFDTDASSSLAILEVGATALDERKTNAKLSCCVGITTVLTPLTWIHRCGLGQISPWGRCFTFDQSASGWVKAEGGSALAIDNLTEVVDGMRVQDANRPYVGTFGSIVITHAGQAAQLGTPHGPAVQELIHKACREAGISPLSLDSVECYGEGQMMNDAVEAHATKKLCCSEERTPMQMGAVKTGWGNGIHSSGMTQILKVIYNQCYGWTVPLIHFRQLNPHVEDIDGTYVNDDILLFPTRTSLCAVTALGWGGTMGEAVCSCGVDAERVLPARPAAPYRPLIFWPVGGEDGDVPDSYHIIGSWGEWSVSTPMEMEGPGIYGVTVTLGANRMEEFHFLCDGNPEKVLHAETPGASSGSRATGPDEDAEGRNWVIDGRVFLHALTYGADETRSDAPQALPSDGPPIDVPPHPSGYYESAVGLGDQYWVRLSIAGKWKAVTWERAGISASSSEALASTLVQDPLIEGKYYISGTFNVWLLEQMGRAPDAAGLYTHDVRLLRAGEYFRILRNKDFSQVFHPATVAARGDNAHDVLGPDAALPHLSWCLDNQAGDIFRIEFQRTVENGLDNKRVSWRKLGHEPLTEVEAISAMRSRFCIMGTWSKWSQGQEMTWNGDCFEHIVEVGKGGRESFQILVEGDVTQVLSPDVEDANPHETHQLELGVGLGNSWTIGAHESEVGSVGTTYKVLLSTDRTFAPQKVTWKPFA